MMGTSPMKMSVSTGKDQRGVELELKQEHVPMSSCSDVTEGDAKRQRAVQSEEVEGIESNGEAVTRSEELDEDETDRTATSKRQAQSLSMKKSDDDNAGTDADQNESVKKRLRSSQRRVQQPQTSSSSSSSSDSDSDDDSDNTEFDEEDLPYYYPGVEQHFYEICGENGDRIDDNVDVQYAKWLTHAETVNSMRQANLKIRTVLRMLLGVIVTRSVLRDSGVGKRVNFLRLNSPDEDIRRLAQAVQTQWIDCISQGTDEEEDALPDPSLLALLDDAVSVLDRYCGRAVVTRDEEKRKARRRAWNRRNMGNAPLVELRFTFDGDDISPREKKSNAVMRNKFASFLEFVRETQPALYGPGWRMECTRKRKSQTSYDFYFISPENDRKRERQNPTRKPSQRVQKQMKLRREEQLKEQQRSSQTPSPPNSKRNKLSSSIKMKSACTEGTAATSLGDTAGFAKLLHKAKRVLVVLGAGVSTSAGLPDFRTKSTGLYAAIASGKLGKDALPAELLFHSETFEQDPVPFYDFASKTFLPLVEKAKPTVTHKFVSELGEKDKLLRCYTQNVDGLEKVAGLPDRLLITCHGTLRTARCMKCRSRVTEPYWWSTKNPANKGVPECNKPGCSGDMRPDMIFFGEPVSTKVDLYVQRDAKKCDLVIVIGTSLSVQPVSDILTTVPEHVPRVWINRASPPENLNFAIVQRGDCDDIIKNTLELLDW